jgi:hypothetical protein
MKRPSRLTPREIEDILRDIRAQNPTISVSDKAIRFWLLPYLSDVPMNKEEETEYVNALKVILDYARGLMAAYDESDNVTRSRILERYSKVVVAVAKKMAKITRPQKI